MSAFVMTSTSQPFVHTAAPPTATTMSGLGFFESITAEAVLGITGAALGIAAQERQAYLAKKDAQSQQRLLEQQLAAQQALLQQQQELERLKVETAQQQMALQANQSSLLTPITQASPATLAAVGVGALLLLMMLLRR